MSRVLLLLLLVVGIHRISAGPVVRFRSGLGDVYVELYDREKPITTSNFLAYVRSGAYSNMFAHRMVSDFVIQGGGFRVANRGTAPSVESVPAFPTIPNEFGVGPRYSNLYGTISMAKIGAYTNNLGSVFVTNAPTTFPELVAAATNVVTYPVPFADVAYTNHITDRITATNGAGATLAWTVQRTTVRIGGGPDSASSQWFLSVNNNAGNLDNQNGGFTVFGRVVGDLEVFNRLNTFAPVLRATNVIVNAGGSFGELPVLTYPVNQPGGPTTAQLFASLVYFEISEMPELRLPPASPTTPGVAATGLAGFTNRVQAATSPVGPWETLSTFVGDGTVRSVADPAGTGTNRFYRIEIPTTLPRPL